MKTHIRRTIVIATAAVSGLLASPLSPIYAQHQVAGPRWQGWIGCWSAAKDQASDSLQKPGRVVCVTPTSDADVVDVSAIDNGKVLSRDRIDASGRPQNIDANGCKGTAHAQWSDDQRRVFLKSSVTCDSVVTDVSGMLAITQSGDWVDIRSVSFGGGANVQVARYRDIGITKAIPADIAKTLNDRRRSPTARIAAGAPFGTGAIVEASRLSDSTIVDTWITESGQRFSVDAGMLSALADSGVPSRVTDAMVASSNRTDVARSGGQYSFYDYRFGQFANGSIDQGPGLRVITVAYPAYDSWAYPYWSNGYLFGFSPYVYSPFFYAPFGYASFVYAPVIYSGFGFASYGYAPYGFGVRGFRNYGFAPFGFRPGTGRVVGHAHAIGFVSPPPVTGPRFDAGAARGGPPQRGVGYTQAFNQGYVQNGRPVGNGYTRGYAPANAQSYPSERPMPPSGGGYSNPGRAAAAPRQSAPQQRPEGGGSRSAHGSSRR